MACTMNITCAIHTPPCPRRLLCPKKNQTEGNLENCLKRSSISNRKTLIPSDDSRGLNFYQPDSTIFHFVWNGKCQVCPSQVDVHRKLTVNGVSRSISTNKIKNLTVLQGLTVFQKGKIKSQKKCNTPGVHGSVPLCLVTSPFFYYEFL